MHSRLNDNQYYSAQLFFDQCTDWARHRFQEYFWVGDLLCIFGDNRVITPGLFGELKVRDFQ